MKKTKRIMGNPFAKNMGAFNKKNKKWQDVVKGLVLTVSLTAS